MKAALLAFLISFGSFLNAKADIPSVHGMLMFGDKKIYASHLPMFHIPHNYQVILEISIENATRSQTFAYYESLKASGSEQFTLEPEVMDLTRIISGEKTSFGAKLYKGHFERGGTLLGSVKVKVEKVVFSKTLDTNEASNGADYLFFGAGDEYFAAHVIQGQPGFDQILQIAHPNWGRVPACRTRLCETEPVQTPAMDSNFPKVITQATMEDPLQLKPGSFLGAFDGFNSSVLKVLYTEVDELSH